MKKIPVSLLPACLLLLAGCQQIEPGSGNTTESATPAGTTAPETTEPAEDTTPKATTTHSSAMFTKAETTETTSLISTFSETLPPLYPTEPLPEDVSQGGEGGEEHGNDPDPSYFNYRFLPDGVSMRLAGGNYQVIPYDFSDMVIRGTVDYYFIEDINFNGSPDLFAAASFQNSDIIYAVFLWNPETLHFETEPLLLSNPVCHADTKTVTTTEQLEENTAVITAYRWDSDNLVPAGKYTADYAALTVTEETDGAEKTTKTFTDRDELTAYFLTLR